MLKLRESSGTNIRMWGAHQLDQVRVRAECYDVAIVVPATQREGSLALARAHDDVVGDQRDVCRQGNCGPDLCATCICSVC